MIRREFRSRRGSTQRFWAIELEGVRQRVEYGRVGGLGQSRSREFEDPVTARRSFDRLVAEKIRQGYREVEGEDATGDGPDAQASGVHLSPRDWRWATWRNLPPLERGPAPRFDRRQGLARLRRAEMSDFGMHVDWSGAKLTASMSPREAWFWLESMTAGERFECETIEELAERVASLPLDQEPTLEAAEELLAAGAAVLRSEILLPLVNLFSTAELVGLFRNACDKDTIERWSFQCMTELILGYWRYVAPWLTDEERSTLADDVREHLDLEQRNVVFHREFLPAEHYLAPLLRMHEETEALVESWKDDRYADPMLAFHQSPQVIVFGLGAPEIVESHTRRLGLELCEPDFIRAWLAHTELSALDYACEHVLLAEEEDEGRALVEALANAVQSPVAIPGFERLKTGSVAPDVAERWLATHSSSRAPEGMGALLPALAEGARTPRLPAWLAVDQLPPLRIGTDELESGALAPLIAALKRSELAGVGTDPRTDPLVTQTRSHADPASLDHFARELLDQWLSANAPNRDRWALEATGFLGGEECVRRLADLLEEWPTEGRYRRAIVGLHCLREIGHDVALQRIRNVADEAKAPTLRDTAKKLLGEESSPAGDGSE